MGRLAGTCAVLAAVMATAPRPARADLDLRNALIGPLIGVRLGSAPGPRGVFGIEGGLGFGPERINVGIEHRSGTSFSYIELDPWFVVGGSLGVGVDGEGVVRPVLGAWEGVPLELNRRCGPDRQAQDAKEALLTFAVGYRYTGTHELYVTVKAGISGNLCSGY